MNERAEVIRKQVVEMWAKTIKQMEGLSKTLMSGGLDKFKVEHAKLMGERDRLIGRLGEEVYKLMDAGKIKVPPYVSQIYVRVRGVMDKLMLPAKSAPKKSKAKKARPSRARSARNA
jgi:hypothetical protein